MQCALVGCGYWGEKVLKALCEPQESQDLGVLEPYGTRLLQRAEFRLIGIYDSSLDNAQKARQAYPHLRIYPSYEALLADKQIEAVFLITPPASHFPLAKAALESKKHIFVEKPLALSSKECALLYELASKQGVVLHCDHIFLYAPAVQWLQAHIHDFGQIHSIHARRESLGRLQKEVSVVWDLALHDVAILDYVLGAGVLEQMKPCAKVVEVEGYRALADISLVGGGANIAIRSSWLSPTKVREMVLVGTRGVGVVYDEVAENKLTLFSVDSVLGNQSRVGFLAQKSCREQTALESSFPQNFQNLQSPTATPRILEEEKGAEREKSASPSLRADSSAWQSTQTKTHNLESTFDKNAKLQNEDSRENAKNVSKQPKDSRISKETSANAERYPLFSKEATLCHADKSARNDGKNATTLKTPAQDSRISKETCELTLAPLRLFCDEKTRRSRSFFSKSGLCKRVQGRILGVCNRSAQQAFKDLSRKAESSSQKPTPKPSKAQFSNQAELPATPPLISSIAHFYAQITQGQICPELAQHTIRVVQILEQIDAATLR